MENSFDNEEFYDNIEEIPTGNCDSNELLLILNEHLFESNDKHETEEDNPIAEVESKIKANPFLYNEIIDFDEVQSEIPAENQSSEQPIETSSNEGFQPIQLSDGNIILWKILQDTELPDAIEDIPVTNLNDDDQGSVVNNLNNHSSSIEVTKVTNDKNFSEILEIKKGKNMHLCKEPGCGKSYSNSSHLKQHIFKHTENFIYNCKYCEKSFRLLAYLRRHERSHSNEKPFKCKYCSKYFKTPSQRSIHHRIHLDLRPYTCDVPDCNMKFRTITIKKQHMLNHSGVRPYICKTCDKTFKTMTNLKNHENIHLNNRPFQCQLCMKAFTEYSTLKKHFKVHNKQYFSCSECIGIIFKNDIQLQQHIDASHTFI